MDFGSTWMFTNGSNAQGAIGTYDRTKQLIYINTTNSDDVGLKQTRIRGCTTFGDLLEIYLYVNVMENTYPDFVTEVQVSFNLFLD